MKITLGQPHSFYQLGRRGNQEDARFPDTDSPSATASCYVVCDGVGGLEKGELASRCVAGTLGELMAGVDLSQPFTARQFGKVLGQTYDALDKLTAANSGSDMGTTLTFVCFSADGAFCAHIGDSRIYQIRPGVGAVYRSDDHSLVNALVKSGEIKAEEAENHPLSNVITRCMGTVEGKSRHSAATTYMTSDVLPGDYFFLCSDGVLHCVNDEELVDILSDKNKTDKEKTEILARKCHTSSDNNTAILIPVAQVADKPKKPTEPVTTEVEIRENAPASRGLFGRIIDWLNQR